MSPAAEPREPIEPVRRAVRLTPAGRGALACSVLLSSWVLLDGGPLPRALFAAGAALLAVTPVWAWLQVRGLGVVPPEPTTVFAGRAFPVEVALTRRSREIAAHDLELAFDVPGPGAAQRGGWVAAVPAGATVPATVFHPALERGRSSSLRLVVSTSYPLALAEARAEFELPALLLVLPRLGSLANPGSVAVPALGLDRSGSRDPRGEEDLHGLREWREGDSLRRIHWKISARRGRRVLREFRSASRAPVHIVLVSEVPLHAALRSRHGAFERAVGLTATLADHFLRGRHPLRLSLLGPAPVTVGGRHGRSALFPVLAALADVRPHVAPEEDDDARGAACPAALRPRKGEVCYLVSAGAVPRPWLLPHVRHLDVEDPAVRRGFRRTRPPGSRDPLTRRVPQ